MKIFTKLLMLCAFCLFANSAKAQIYVDASKTSGANNGTSWTNAYVNLQDALNAATTGDQIWVAKGTYYPTAKLDPAGTDRDKTFILKEGVKVYGGFTGAGTETSVNDRVNISTTNETILSGDFNNDDVTTLDPNGTIESITGNTENAHHVVISYNHSTATVLDGFTIKGGNADGTGNITVDADYDFARNSGGGVYARYSSPILNNLVIKNNHALLNGAGIYISSARKIESPKSGEDLVISNSLLEYNWGSNVGTSFTGSAGAGIAVTGTSGYIYKASFSNLIFNGNWGGGMAGALRVFANLNAEVSNCTFTKNKSRHGGAVYVQSNPLTPLKIIGCTFTKNFGSNGGAIEGNNSTNLVLENTVFNENNATNGGGIYILGGDGARSVLNVTGGEFNENIATTGGGIRVSQSVELNIDGTNFIKNTGGAINLLGVADLPSNAIISNASFIENSFTEGGAIRTSTNSTLNLVNSNFKKNTATVNGGAIFMTGLAAPNISVVNISGGVFEENYTDGMGGALYRATNSKLSINNAQFLRNAPKGSGAAIYVSGDNGAEDSYNNILFYQNNSTTSSGGGITIAGAAKAKLVGATFYGNGGTVGGAIRMTSTSGSLKLYNSIIYNNTARTDNTHDISDAGATVDIKNTLTQVYGNDGINGVKVGATPLFMSTTYGEPLFLRPSAGVSNPILDAGDNLLIPASISIDLAGLNRIGGSGTVDMGAYEYHTVLPIKLLDFSTKANNNSIVINWTTASETNNSHFVLERSADGVNFVTITTPISKGNGANYSHTDFSPVSGNNYYKLTQVDNDGTKVTYETIVVNFSLKANEVNVYPNPAVGGKITINLAGNKFTKLQLVNLQGQSLQSLKIAANETEKTVDISNYPSGTYFIFLSDGTNITTKKVIKP